MSNPGGVRVHSRRQQKVHKRRHEGEGARRQAKGTKHDSHKHLQKEEDINERGKFTRREIESNWSRYDNEGEVSRVASAGETRADEELSAVAASEDESRAHQEDLRFKQLVQSAKHRLPLAEVASEEESRSFSSELFQINISSLAESIQNIPLNEQLLMDKGLLVEAGLMEDNSQKDGKLQNMTLNQLRRHRSEDVPCSRVPQRLQMSSARALKVSTDLVSSPSPKLDKVRASGDTQPVANRHTSGVAEQAMVNATRQEHSSGFAFQKPRADSSRTAAVLDDSGSMHMPGSNAPLHVNKLCSVGGVAPTTPIEMSLTQPYMALGPPKSEHKMVGFVQTLNPSPVQGVVVEEKDRELEAMLDELLTL